MRRQAAAVLKLKTAHSRFVHQRMLGKQNSEHDLDANVEVEHMHIDDDVMTDNSYNDPIPIEQDVEVEVENMHIDDDLTDNSNNNALDLSSAAQRGTFKK